MRYVANVVRGVRFSLSAPMLTKVMTFVIFNGFKKRDTFADIKGLEGMVAEYHDQDLNLVESELRTECSGGVLV